MKKILMGFAVASIFAACGDSKTTTDSTTADSTNVKVDTSAITLPAVDSTINQTSKDTASKKY